MDRQITVIPSDGTIAVNGNVLLFSPFQEGDIHAIQWNAGEGHIEYVGASQPNLRIKGEAAWSKYIKNHAERWQQTWEEMHKPPSLQEAKESARAKLKSFRQQIEASGFTFMGQHWDSEQKDELRLNSATKIFEAGLQKPPAGLLRPGFLQRKYH